MEEIIIKAMERTEKPNKVRNAGFIPGVLSGPGKTSTSVKFESAVLNKIITKHGANAKLWVVLGDKKQFGFINEVQRHPVEGKIIHISIQLVAENQTVKMHLPINFLGHAELVHKLLQLQVCKSTVEVTGNATIIPDEVVVDVSEKKSGENVTSIDFHLPEGIKTLDPENEIYAIIKAVKEVVEEVVEEKEVVEEAEEIKPAE